MKPTHPRRGMHGAAWAVSLACLLSACAGNAPPTQWLSLPWPSGLVAASAQQTKQANAPVLIVHRVGVPEYLQTNKVRYRMSGSVLGEWPQYLWAERLEVAMTDHLVMRLRALLPDWTVCERICPPGLPKATIGLDLAPLDYVRSSGQLQAGARWDITLRNLAAGLAMTTVSGSHMYNLPVQADGVDGAQAQAAAMGQLLNAMAKDLADSLRASSKYQP